MNLELDPPDYEDLTRLLESWCGIRLDANQLYLVQARLSPLARDLGCPSLAAFVNKLRLADATLRQAVVERMVTHETSFFRDQRPFVFIRDQLIPHWRELLQQGRRVPIRAWSAACATGQEPYSLAMLWAQANLQTPDLHDRLAILATDISTTALRQAEAGRYDGLAAARGLDEELRRRWFTSVGRDWVANGALRRLITWQQANLLSANEDPGRHDLILCRNVAIYYGQDNKRRLFSLVERALAPEGVLLLGAAESVTAYSNAFAMHEWQRTIYYQRHGSTGPVRSSSASARLPPVRTTP